MKERFHNILYMASAIAVLIGSAFYMISPEYMRIIFSVGAAGMAISRLSSHYTGDNKRLKRLYRIQKMAPLALVFASYMMYQPHNQWVPLLMIASALELYSTSVISKIEKE